MKKTKPPVPNLLSKRASVATAITKANTTRKTDKPVELGYDNISKITKSITDKLASNDEILHLFPDVELAIQILVASILSPNNLVESKLSYHTENLDIPNNIDNNILSIISSYIEKNYELESKLSTILREALFTRGAYAEMIIPDTNVLEVSKAAKTALSTESLVDGLTDVNYLSGTSDSRLSLETMVDHLPQHVDVGVTEADLGISFTENIGAVQAASAFLDNLSTESAYTVPNTKPTLSAFMKSKKVKGAIYSVTTSNEFGSPMCVKLPVESVIPIHLTSDPSKHISYFVVLDQNGIPVSGNGLGTTIEATDPNNKNDAAQHDVKAAIIHKASEALKTKLNKDVVLDNVNEIYKEALVGAMKNRVQNGKLSTLATVPDTSDLYQLIATRAFKGLKTRLLFVPKGNLSYFAFEHRNNGTGKSMLEKSVMLFSIRAANLFTRIMANIKNSVTTTKVTATLDETDPDPERTREMIINHAMKSEQAKYPLGVMNVKDLTEWMHSVGYRFDIKHPGFPDIEIDMSEDNKNIATPDDSLDEMIQDHIIMSFGLKRSMISIDDASFAASVVANNMLLAKRVMDYQSRFCPMLSKHIQRIMNNDGILKSKVVDVIESNIKPIRSMIKKGLTKDEYNEYKSEIDHDESLVEYVYSEYVDNITAKLPNVEISREEGSLEGLDAFTSMLETYLPMVISSETLPSELVGDLSDKMDDVMSAIKTVLIKNWMDDRNFLPELTKFTTLDNTGAPRYDILEEYGALTKALSSAIIPHLKKLKKESDKADDKLTKIEDGDTEDEQSSDATDDNTSVDDTADTGDTGSSDTVDTEDTATSDTSSEDTGEDTSSADTGEYNVETDPDLR